MASSEIHVSWWNHVWLGCKLDHDLIILADKFLMEPGFINILAVTAANKFCLLEASL
jgi:hypothetical protein